MTAARALPATEPPESANDKFKAGFRTLFSTSLILATLAHFVAFAYWPELTTQDVSFTSDELTSIELPPDIEIPPPPKAIARPAVPIVATTDIDEDITIAPTTFETNPVSDLPPPPTETALIAQDDLASGPVFTPFTVAPKILNRDEVAQAMVNAYPVILRSAGIGGTVRVFFFINEDGAVQDYRIQTSSGYAQLDEAALAVAGLYRFSPALNRDKKVPVWVLFPIEFHVK
jgi:periplasmic protein TonB